MISNENNLQFRNRLELKKKQHPSNCEGCYIIITILIVSMIVSSLLSKKANAPLEQSNVIPNTTNHASTNNNNSRLNIQPDIPKHVMNKYFLNENGTTVELLSEFDNRLLFELPFKTCILSPEAKITIPKPPFPIKCIELTLTEEDISLDFSVQLSYAQIKNYDVDLYIVERYTNIRTHVYNDIYKYKNSIRICSKTFKQFSTMLNKDRIILEISWNQQQQKYFCFYRFKLI